MNACEQSEVHLFAKLPVEHGRVTPARLAPRLAALAGPRTAEAGPGLQAGQHGAAAAGSMAPGAKIASGCVRDTPNGSRARI